ncbi:MAG: flavin reductase domain protein FMN-binding protein [Bradyrhizobium sp.]|nr:flavin reductase domain protein FMN-binding protein [Bradyrhizobium sp.]
MNIVHDTAEYRRIMGHYPTGVCVITALQADGVPAAMVVGSFTSASLDPPLIAFFPDKGSTSWPKIEASGGFCVNVLADDQEAVCRTIASKSPDRFAAMAYRLSDWGTPILDGALAWIDCAIHAVHEAGDHYIAVGHVRGLDLHHQGTPLLFHKGGYNRIQPL